MSAIRTTGARLCAVLFILLFCSTAFADFNKVEVCHIPQGDPDNFHTIKISEKALAAHLAHFDLIGACNNICAELCDDGNACTIDDFGDCQQNGCPVDSVPVDCGDNNLCTDDLCDPGDGCYNPVAVTCEAPDLCTSSSCDPNAGTCEDTPVICGDGETCNSDNGLCEEDGTPPNPDACPCFTNESDLLGLGNIESCDYEEGYPLIIYRNGTLACSGNSCVTLGSVGCGYKVPGSALHGEDPITGLQDQNCRALIANVCQ